MNVERLRHLIKVLEKVPPSQLNMRVWRCGTKACAAGWACLDPQFQKAGLHMREVGSSLLSDVPEFKGEAGYTALEQFFGLSEEQTEHLFAPYAYTHNSVAPKTVIARIESLLEGAANG